LRYRKRKGEATTSTSKKPSQKSKKDGTSSTLVAEAPATISTSLVSHSPVSPGPITRRMAASTSTPTKPPETQLSPGPTTRSMATQLHISSGGIARRRIIS